MPTSTVEMLDPTRAKISITVTPEELKPSIKHAYEHIAEGAQIPGFRKGKVPAPIIDQRMGRGAVIEHAVSEGLDRFFQEAVLAHQLRPVGRPSADVKQWPSDKDFSGDLLVEIEVDIRPEVKLPEFSEITVTVDEFAADDTALDAELDQLRARFGTLIPVDRPVAMGDFVEIDLVAVIDGAEIDRADSVSYEVGSGELLEGIDEALESLTVGEDTTFRSTLIGGDHQGQTAEVSVKVNAVKERELPEADDDFAQMASEFDTIAELRQSLVARVDQQVVFQQGSQAREKLVEALIERLDIPVPQKLVDDEVHNHLEAEGRLEDDVHRAEVIESTSRQFRTQVVLDAIVEKVKVDVTQEELSQYLVQSAAQYGMAPQEFFEALQETDQIASVVAEVSRSKAVSVALGSVNVVDAKGKKVDLSSILPASDAGDDEAAEKSEEAPAKKKSSAKAKK